MRFVDQRHQIWIAGFCIVNFMALHVNSLSVFERTAWNMFSKLRIFTQLGTYKASTHVMLRRAAGKSEITFSDEEGHQIRLVKGSFGEKSPNIQRERILRDLFIDEQQ